MARIVPLEKILALPLLQSPASARCIRQSRVAPRPRYATNRDQADEATTRRSRADDGSASRKM